jgi:hypothetical protein
VSDETTKRITRRDALRKGAKLGGAVLWIAPAIQTLPRPALAHVVGSPLFTCCECRPGTPSTEVCTGGDATNRLCTPGIDEAACISLCAGRSQGYCFHAGPTMISCAGSSGQCQGH